MLLILLSILILLLKVNAHTLSKSCFTLTHAIAKAPTFLAFAGTLNSRGVSGINLRGAEFGSTTGN